MIWKYMKTKYIWVLIFSMFQASGLAQNETEPFIIIHGKLHVGNGTVIENSFIYCEKGKIVYAGPITDEVVRKYDKTQVRHIDATGEHVYPGLIALNTILGLNELDAVRATRDYHEVGVNNANVRALIAFNTDSKILPTLTFNGVFMAEIRPEGGLISGTGSLVKLEAWNWEDAAIKADATMHLNWPSPSVHHGWWAEPGETESRNRDSEMASLRRIFEEAKAYASLSNPSPVNLKYEAMRGLFNGSCRLMVHAQDRISISSALAFCRGYGIKPVIVGGEDAWMITDELKEASASVVISRTHRLPSRNDDAVHLPYGMPQILKAAGIPFAISDVNSWEQRNLPFQAGTAVAFGLTEEDALSAITLEPARILGIADRCGSVEAGKDATLIISKGNLLDPISNELSTGFILGKEVNLLNHQRMLYDKYKMKYQLMKN